MTEKSCREDLLCGINVPAKEDELSDLEKKHLPVIQAPDDLKPREPFEVVVEVGKLLKHPNEPAHFIQWVELYSGDTFLGRQEFTPGITEPIAKFTVKLEHLHTLRAIERCNIHGLWAGKKELPVDI